MIIRTLSILGAFLAPLWFPYYFTLFVSCLVGFFMPWLPLLLGIFTDVLYYTPGVGWPLATCFGVLGSIGMYFVRRIVKTRIMN